MKLILARFCPNPPFFHKLLLIRHTLDLHFVNLVMLELVLFPKMEANCRVDLVVEELTTLHSKLSFVSLFPCDYMLCVLQRVLVCLYVHTVCLLQVLL
jgi:hypothetical protein